MCCNNNVDAAQVSMLEPIETTCEGVIGGIGRLIGQCTPFSSFNFTNDTKTGFPSTKDCLTRSFSNYYQTPDVASAWQVRCLCTCTCVSALDLTPTRTPQNFYHYKNVQEKFVAYWNVTASSFAGSPGVLG